MKDDIFEEFKKYAKGMFGYDIVNVEPSKAVTFDKLFGGSFIETEQLLRLPDENIDILITNEYSNIFIDSSINQYNMVIGCELTDEIPMAA